jgi:ribonuclease R
MKETVKNAVLRVIGQNGEAMEPQKVFVAVRAKSQADFDHVVRELENDGQLIVTKKGKLASTKSSGLLPAKVVSQSKGFLFVRPIEGGEDVYVPVEKSKSAMLGDAVLLGRLNQSERGLDAVVERVLVRGNRLITGTILRERGRCELIPDCAIRFHIPVERGAMMGARNGQKVQAALSKRPHRPELHARVVKIYGDAQSARICADAILDAHHIPQVFPEEVEKAARRLAKYPIREKDLADRIDLRGERILTIDGPDAKDLDDAISVRKTEDGWFLGVHIADVSHFVRLGDPIDLEAQQRGTSVYFADRVVPMLPKELSNGLCSLNAGEDKLAFSALMELDKNGDLVEYSFQKSIICSQVRGVYGEVNALFSEDAPEALRNKYSPVMQTLQDGRELAVVLQRAAAQRGTMDLESTECKFQLNDAGVCVAITLREQGESEQMIEQFMIKANEAAARLAQKLELPFVYRVHESPDPSRVETLRELAGALGLPTHDLREGGRAADFAKLLQSAQDTPAARVISHQVLRTMAKARYDDRPLGHFGLALKDYCHFTSPIRRYPDTAIHRILSEYAGGASARALQKKYTEFAARAAAESSAAEVRAMQAERSAEKCYMAEYMVQHLGEEFDGTVSGVTARGIFVALSNGVEGFVGLEQFPLSRFRFDGLVTQTDEASGNQITIGDPLRVQVVAADVATGMIDMAPVPGYFNW